MYEGRGGGRKPQRTAKRGGAGRRARGVRRPGAWSLEPGPCPCLAAPLLDPKPLAPSVLCSAPLSWAPHTGLSPGVPEPSPAAAGTRRGHPASPEPPGHPGNYIWVKAADGASPRGGRGRAPGAPSPRGAGSAKTHTHLPAPTGEGRPRAPGPAPHTNPRAAGRSAPRR